MDWVFRMSCTCNIECNAHPYLYSHLAQRQC